MTQAVPFLVAAFALSAASTYIQHQDAKKKEKRIKQQLDIQKELEKQRLAAKKQRDDDTLKIKGRFRVGAISRLFAGRELYRQIKPAIQGVRSSLEGQLDYNQEAFEREQRYIESRTELMNIQGETSPFSTQLATSALDLGAGITGKLGMSKIS